MRLAFISSVAVFAIRSFSEASVHQHNTHRREGYPQSIGASNLSLNPIKYPQQVVRCTKKKSAVAAEKDCRWLEDWHRKVHKRAFCSATSSSATGCNCPASHRQQHNPATGASQSPAQIASEDEKDKSHSREEFSASLSGRYRPNFMMSTQAEIGPETLVDGPKQLSPEDNLLLSTTHKLVIIGSGPAAMTAAIYASRANLSPIVFEGFMAGNVPPGGQLMTTTDVENYPGFPEGVLGADLMDKMREQAVRFGTVSRQETIEAVDLCSKPFRLYRTSDMSDLPVKTEALIIATGATAKRLEIPGARDGELWQRGVSACAVCDGALPLFRDGPVFVIGGGDTAMEEAMFLTKYASSVTIVHRRNEFRASKIMQARALGNPKIKVMWDSVVEEAKGGDNGFLGSLVIKNIKTGMVQEVPAVGLFFAIGHEPMTGFLGEPNITRDATVADLPGCPRVLLDATGYIVLSAPGTTQTTAPGVFAAGDVADHRYRQAITAAGTGCMAALDAEHYLSALEHERQQLQNNSNKALH